MQFRRMKLGREVQLECIEYSGEGGKVRAFPAGTTGTAVRLESGHYHLNVQDEEGRYYDGVVGLGAIYLGDVVATANEG